jgi:hypothetical protein
MGVSAEALEVLTKMGIDVEDIKNKLASGEWFAVIGDSECVLDIVEATRHAAIIIAVKSGTLLCLVKKTEAFKAATGLDDDVLRRLVFAEVVRIPRGCAVHSTLEDSPEEAAEAIASAIVEGAERALERARRGEESSYIQ